MVAADERVPAPVQELLLEHVHPFDALFNMDAWDGAPAARERLFRIIEGTGARNPIVLSGDIHSAWGAHLLRDFSDPDSAIVAAEFVCTSVTSDFHGLDPRPAHRAV